MNAEVDKCLMFVPSWVVSWCGVLFRHRYIPTSGNNLFLYTNTQRRLLNSFIFTFVWHIPKISVWVLC